MSKTYHFCRAKDAKKQLPKMPLERLVDEFTVQVRDSHFGLNAAKGRAKRIIKLIEFEVAKRDAEKEFRRLLDQKKRMVEKRSSESAFFENENMADTSEVYYLLYLLMGSLVRKTNVDSKYAKKQAVSWP